MKFVAPTAKRIQLNSKRGIQLHILSLSLTRHTLSPYLSPPLSHKFYVLYTPLFTHPYKRYSFNARLFSNTISLSLSLSLSICLSI